MKKEKKKKGGIVGWIILLLVFTAAGFFIRMNLPGVGHNTVIETKTLKSELVKISELATYQKEYRETVSEEKEGLLPKRYFATFDGVIKAGIKMEKVDVSVEKSEEDDSQAVDVTLPEAEILTHTDGNWEDVYEEGYQGKGLGDDRNKIIKERKAQVEREFKEEGGLDKASEKAKEVISDFIRTAYGDDVVVTFNGEEAA